MATPLQRKAQVENYALFQLIGMKSNLLAHVYRHRNELNQQVINAALRAIECIDMMESYIKGAQRVRKSQRKRNTEEDKII